MVPYETPPPLSPNAPNYHDDGSSVATGDISNKQLLQYDGAVNSGMLADGGSAAGDLAFALDNIYNHPNVGPFLARQLIQRLVTSNPSPAYVQRVAAVFDANRASGTQLQAVVRAILLDPQGEYRAQLAKLFTLARRDGDAAAALRDAEQALPTDALSRDTMGCVYARLGDHAAALPHFAEAVRLAEADKEVAPRQLLELRQLLASHYKQLLPQAAFSSNESAADTTAHNHTK